MIAVLRISLVLIMAQSLFCDTCGRFTSVLLPKYRDFEGVGPERRLELFREQRLPGIPELSESIVKGMGSMDLMSCLYGPIKLCCRRAIQGTYRKEEILSGTGEKYVREAEKRTSPES